jgi:hypothetical protein
MIVYRKFYSSAPWNTVNPQIYIQVLKEQETELLFRVLETAGSVSRMIRWKHKLHITHECLMELLKITATKKDISDHGR